MGTVLQLTMSLEAITNGPLLGTFTIGILIPWVVSGCALTGGIVGVAFMSWLSLKAQYWVATGTIVFPHKPMSVDGCSYDFDRSLINATSTSLYTTDDIFPLFRVSYMWYTFLGAAVTIFVSLLSTMLIYGRIDPKTVSPDLLAGFVSRYVLSAVSRPHAASGGTSTNGKTNMHEPAL